MNLRILGLFSLAFSIALDALAILAFAGKGLTSLPPWEEVLIFHSAAVAAACIALWLWAIAARIGSAWILPALTASLCAPAPVAGQIVSLALGSIILAKKVTRIEHTYVLGESEALTETVPDLSPYSQVSVLAILRGRDVSLRRRAVLALRAVDPRRSVPVLQKAIQDSDEQVRLMAQTLLNRIVSGLETRLKAREAALTSSGNSPRRRLELAELYHEMMFLGLASEETETIYLARAIELLESALRDDASLTSAHRLLLRCHLRSRALTAAQASLEALRTAGEPPQALAPWEAEWLFLKRDWPRLRELLRTIQRQPPNDTRFRRVIDFCLEPKPSKEHFA